MASRDRARATCCEGIARALAPTVAFVVAATASACGSNPPPAPPPWPDARTAAAAASEGAAPVGPAPEPWDLAAALAASRVVFPRGPSQHFGGDVEGEILANAAAAGYVSLGAGRELAIGAAVLERHSGSVATAASVFAMVKRPKGYDPTGGDWEYLILDAEGHVERRGHLPLCARCHADGPRDHLFGGSRPH